MRWAIEITRTDPSRLTIVDPPFVLGVWICGAIALALAGVAWLLPGFLSTLGGQADAPPQLNSVLRWSSTLVRLSAGGAALIFAALSWACGATWSEATFSRESGRLEVVHRNFLRTEQSQTPLGEITRIEVDTPRWGRQLLALNKEGEPIRLTRSSNRSGHYEAAQAAREFLGLSKDSP